MAVRRTKLSEEIKQDLLIYIEDMRRDKVDKFPSEDNLSKMFKVSRATIRTVLNDLENDGIIIRKHGIGTFLNEMTIPFHVQFSPVSLYADMIKEYGYEYKSMHIGSPEVVEGVEPGIYEKLKIEKDEKLIFTKKLFYADNKPCVFCIDYFPLKLVKDAALMDKIGYYEESLFQFLECELGRKIVSDQAEIRTTTSEETEVLKTYFPATTRSFLQLNCINYDEDNVPVLYAEEYIDTNLIRFYSMRKK